MIFLDHPLVLGLLFWKCPHPRALPYTQWLLNQLSSQIIVISWPKLLLFHERINPHNSPLFYFVKFKLVIWLTNHIFTPCKMNPKKTNPPRIALFPKRSTPNSSYSPKGFTFKIILFLRKKNPRLILYRERINPQSNLISRDELTLD